MMTKSAAELDIQQFELSALLEFRELLAKDEFVHDQDCAVERPNGFNMNIIQHETDCGTTCCIGGWMFLAMKRDRTAPCHNIATYVNHQRSPALAPLFYPFHDGDDEIDFPLDLIPPAFALKAIDNFLSTGHPNWPAACGIENLEVGHA